MRSALTVGVIAVIALSCEPRADEPRTEARAGAERALCEARCARSIRCDGPRAATCDCGRVEDTGLLRPDWATAEIGCLGRRPCDVDDCEAEAYRGIGATPLEWPAVVMRCLERGSACGGSSVTCRRLAALTDDARAEAARCFEQPCDQYADCFRGFLASRVAPAVPSWR